jgi:hypothetical protein
MKVYQRIAQLLQAIHNCQQSDNEVWLARHTGELERLADNYLPSGSGFDAGTTIDIDASDEKRIVLQTSYHHMNEAGFYDGWTEHTVKVYPSFVDGIRLHITGRDRNMFKDYAWDVFFWALQAEAD